MLRSPQSNPNPNPNPTHAVHGHHNHSCHLRIISTLFVPIVCGYIDYSSLMAISSDTIIPIITNQYHINNTRIMYDIATNNQHHHTSIHDAGGVNVMKF